METNFKVQRFDFSFLIFLLVIFPSISASNQVCSSLILSFCLVDQKTDLRMLNLLLWSNCLEFFYDLVLWCWNWIWWFHLWDFGFVIEDIDKRRDCCERSSTGGCWCLCGGWDHCCCEASHQSMFFFLVKLFVIFLVKKNEHKFWF